MSLIIIKKDNYYLHYTWETSNLLGSSSSTSTQHQNDIGSKFNLCWNEAYNLCNHPRPNDLIISCVAMANNECRAKTHTWSMTACQYRRTLCQGYKYTDDVHGSSFGSVGISYHRGTGIRFESQSVRYWLSWVCIHYYKILKGRECVVLPNILCAVKTPWIFWKMYTLVPTSGFLLLRSRA